MKTIACSMITVISLSLIGSLRAGPPSVADVGDPDSFGHAAQYMGAASGFVTLSPACTPAPSPVPPSTANNDQCFTLNPAPVTTSFDAEDICRIKLPKNSTRDIIYPVLNFFHNYTLQNTTGSPQPQAIFDYTASITIDSAALNDPSGIDPATGDPAAGHLVFQFADNRYRDEHNMNDGDRAHNRLNYTHAGNAGISKRALVASGIPQMVADKMFQGEMTLHLNITGTAKLVTVATITGNMRLFGD